MPYGYNNRYGSITPFPVDPAAQLAGAFSDIEEQGFKRRRNRRQELADILKLGIGQQNLAKGMADLDQYSRNRAFEELTRPYLALGTRMGTIEQIEGMPYRLGERETPVGIEHEKRRLRADFFADRAPMLDPTLFSPQERIFAAKTKRQIMQLSAYGQAAWKEWETGLTPNAMGLNEILAHPHLRQIMPYMRGIRQAQAGLAREEMRQTGATQRTGMQQGGAMARTQVRERGATGRTEMQQEGAMDRAQLRADTARDIAAARNRLVALRARVRAALSGGARDRQTLADLSREVNILKTGTQLPPELAESLTPLWDAIGQRLQSAQTFADSAHNPQMQRQMAATLNEIDRYIGTVDESLARNAPQQYRGIDESEAYGGGAAAGKSDWRTGPTKHGYVIPSGQTGPSGYVDPTARKALAPPPLWKGPPPDPTHPWIVTDPKSGQRYIVPESERYTYPPSWKAERISNTEAEGATQLALGAPEGTLFGNQPTYVPGTKDLYYSIAAYGLTGKIQPVGPIGPKTVAKMAQERKAKGTTSGAVTGAEKPKGTTSGAVTGAAKGKASEKAQQLHRDAVKAALHAANQATLIGQDPEVAFRNTYQALTGVPYQGPPGWVK